MKQITALFLVSVCFSLSAQDTRNESKHKSGKLTVKWSPLHLINHYPTFQIAIEHRIGENTALQYDFGPVVNMGDQYSSDSFDKRGFKAKFEVRRYILPRAKHWQFYYASEIYFNRVNYNKSDTYGVNCVDGNCDYYQQITYGMHYREPGINLKTGTVLHVYRFCIDFQVGMSARFIHYTPVNLPGLAPYIKEDQGNGLFNFGIIERTRNTLSPMACIRLGYIIQYMK